MRVNWKKIWRVAGAVLFWGGLVAFFVATAILRHNNERARRVERVEIVVKDSLQRRFVTPDIVRSLIEEEGVNPVGKRLDSVELVAINRVVENYCFTSKAITYIDYRGTLTVELSQRKPVARVCTRGYDFYVTEDMYVLPTQPHASLNLPVVTGELDLPFGSSFRGSLVEWFGKEEKKSPKSYDFFRKLINFVVYTEESPELKGQFVQVAVVKPSTKASSKNYTEPRVELIPRHGNYTIELGHLEDVEQKLYRWRRFVESGVVNLEGGRVNVEFDGQVVWKAPKAPKKTKK